MQPRLKSSKKWTAFPKEYTQQIESVFMENFAKQLGGSKLIIEGRIYPEEIALRVGFLEQGRLKQANFEVSMDHKAGSEQAVERIHNCIDAAASMMMDYFENDGEVEFPGVWKAYPFQEQTIYLQFSTENSDLEAAADKLLGADEEGLVHGDDESEDEDALARAEIDEDISGGKGLDDDHSHDNDESEGPRMFGPKGKKKKETLH